MRQENADTLPPMTLAEPQMATNFDYEIGAVPRAPSAVLRDFIKQSISLADLAGIVWAGRVVVAASFVLGLLYGSYTAWRGGPAFIASVSVMPSQTDNETGGSGGGGTLGLLAGLTGGSGSAASVPKYTQFMSALSSTSVAQRLDSRYGLVCRIFSDQCDQTTRQWRPRKGTGPWLRGLLAKLQGLPDPNGPRTAVDLAHYIGDAIVPQQNKTNSLITIAYVNSDPQFASRFLMLVFHTTNDYIKDQDRIIQRQYVDYLSHRIATNTNVDQRSALDSLLLQEERKLMMTEVDVPYAATILDGPTVLPLDTAAKKILTYGAVGLVLGALLALLLAPIKKWLTRAS
jgi:hypothetical protein